MCSDFMDIGELRLTEEGDNIPTRSPGASPNNVRYNEMKKKEEMRKKWNDVKSNKLPVHDFIFDPDLIEDYRENRK